MSQRTSRIRPGVWLIASSEVALFLLVFELVMCWAGRASVGAAFGALVFGGLIASVSIVMAVPFLKTVRSPFGYWAVILIILGEICTVLGSSADLLRRSL